MNFLNLNMMKYLKFTLALTALMAVTFSCVEDDEWDVPDTAPEPVQIVGNEISLNDLYSAMEQEDFLLEYDESSNFYVTGYVVSSDRAGNFFEELLIQDSPSNPTRGARIAIDNSPLFTTYNRGRKVYVKLAGLTVTTNTEPEFDNGNLENGDLLGMNIGTDGTLGRIEPIASFEQEQIVIRDSEVAEIVPQEVDFSDFGAENLYTAIQLDNVQFDRRQIDLTFAGEPRDQFDGDRTLVSCENNATTLFQTSTFADYKSINLPDGRGSMNALLTTDFFGENFVVTINNPNDINFDSDDRCDPDFLECDNPNTGGNNVLFEEDFENYSNAGQLPAAGYVNVNVSGGSEAYEIGSFSNNTYLQVNAFGQSDDPMIAWLVLPSVDMDAATDEQLEFSIQANFDQGGLLEVFVSDNFTGDVITTEWTQVDADIPQGPSNGFASGFTDVEPIDISCVTGSDVRIAFRYTGSDPQGTTTRYHIDNISINGN